MDWLGNQSYLAYTFRKKISDVDHRSKNDFDFVFVGVFFFFFCVRKGKPNTQEGKQKHAISRPQTNISEYMTQIQHTVFSTLLPNINEYRKQRRTVTEFFLRPKTDLLTPTHHTYVVVFPYVGKKKDAKLFMQGKREDNPTHNLVSTLNILFNFETK